MAHYSSFEKAVNGFHKEKPIIGDINMDTLLQGFVQCVMMTSIQSIFETCLGYSPRQLASSPTPRYGLRPRLTHHAS